jgi:septum site-determining protein MinD
MSAKVVAVYGGSGGAGRTFVAANLAVSLRQQRGGRILLMDAAFPMPGDTATLVGIDRAKAVGDMEPILDRLSAESLVTYLTASTHDVSVLPLVNDVLQARLLTPGVLDRVFELVSAAFDAVVMDMASGASAITPALLDRAHHVCIVSRCTPAAVARARFCIDYLRSLQVPSEAVMLCLNRVEEPGSLPSERVERVLGMRAGILLPDDPDAVTAAVLKGVPLLLEAPRNAVSRGIDRLGRDLATRGLAGHEALAQGGIARPTTPDADVREVKLKVHRRLVEEIDLRKADLAYLRDPVKLQEMRTRAEAKIQSLVEQEGAHLESREMRRRIVKDLLDEALGLGPLEDLLRDATITEIMVNRHDQIYVERSGRIQLTDAQFLTPEQLRGVIERIVAPLGRRIDEKVPMVDARLRDGSRVNAIIPPLSLRGPVLTIRKFSKKLLTSTELVAFGSMTDQMATFLGAAVQARANIVISGGTGSGKTTLLNVLASYIPSDERIITIEDSAELRLPQAHVITLESRPANIEGEGAIVIRDLVRNALRMRPDRIVVGECRGGEALDMLQAMNTGHDGSLTTVHANAPRDALSRLETMSLMAGLDLPARAIRDQIASAITLVVQQMRLQDGTRRITHITEINGQDQDGFKTADVFVFRQSGVAPDGRVLGQFVPTGYVPAFVDTLTRRGIRVPREIFLHQTA